MPEEVLVKFQTDLNDFKKQLDEVKSKMGGVGDSAKKTGDEMAGSFKGAGDKIGDVLGGIGKALVAAFAVQKIIAFGKESLHAFQEAELAAKKLNVAVGVSGGTQAHFDRLIKQSKELEKISIFSDDAIQQVQTMALQFGLTADQVEKLLPIVADYASATGQDLAAAMQTVLTASNGQMRGLKQYGVVLKDAGNQTDNLANITESLTQKFKGQSQVVAETSSGSMKQLGNAYNNLQEQIGELISKAISPLVSSFTDFVTGAMEVVENINSIGESSEETAISLNKMDAALVGKAIEKSLRLMQMRNEILKAGGILTDEDLKRTEKQFENELKQQEVIALNTQHTKDLSATIADLRQKIEEKKKALEAANTTNGDSILAAQALAAAEDNLTIALGKETEAQKKLREEKEKAAQADKKRMEDLKKQMEDSAAEDEKFALETIARSKEVTQTKLEVENGRFENEKARLDLSQLTKEKSDEVLEALEKEHSVNLQIISNDSNAKILEGQKAVNDEIEKMEKEMFGASAKRDEEEAKRKQEIQEGLLNLSAQVAENIIDINSAINKSVTEANLLALEERRKNEEISEAQFLAQRKVILTKQFEQDKKAALAKAIIDGIAAVISAMKTSPILAAFVAGTVLLQIQKIESQPTPTFHKGKIDITQRNKNSKGEFSATLLEHESVINPAATKKYRKELESINSMNFEDLIYTKYIIPALQLQKREFDKQRNEGFAGNVAKSMMLNAKLNDGNIIEMLKRLNASGKENTRILSGAMKTKHKHYRGNV